MKSLPLSYHIFWDKMKALNCFANYDIEWTIFSWKAVRNSAGVCPSRICARLNWRADSKASIAILPTAAAPDHNHLRAGRNGQRWFELLGASRVDVVPVTDKQSADNPDFVTRVATATFDLSIGRISALSLRDLAR